MVNRYIHQWLPEQTSKSVVIIVHGIGEHGGRYEHVARHLTALGYAVYAPDHHGHGRSGGRRGYFESVEQPSADLAEAITNIQTDHPDTPFFVYGHSMGSLIALRYALQHQDQLTGLMVTGTPLHTDQLYPHTLRVLAPWANRIAPGLPLIPLAVQGISRDPQVIKAAIDDPLTYYGPVRLRMAYFILAESQYLREQVRQLRLPLLILHGADDLISPASGSEFLYQQAQSTDKTLKIYPDLYHEIHNEPEQMTVLEDVANWLNQRTMS